MIKSRGIRWALHVARMIWMRNAYSILVGKPRRKDNIKMDVGEVGMEGVEWINMVG
jgi:hypothetical protein